MLSKFTEFDILSDIGDVFIFKACIVQPLNCVINIKAILCLRG